ncbi:hypothetical protein ACOXN6_002590 [Shigella sonnei]
MLVSKKKYDFLLARYEQAASRADLLEVRSAQSVYGMAPRQSQGEKQ